MNFWEEIYSGFWRAVFSMSEHLQTIGHKLRDKRDVLFEHFIKLYYYKDSQWAGVWKWSIFSAVSMAPFWKGHKFPAWGFIYACLWKDIEDVWDRQFNHWLDLVSQYLEGDFLDKDVMFRNPRPVEVGNMVKTYCYWLSHELEKNGEVSSSKVYETIDWLLGDYPFNPRQP
jgi:hypothetical protein